METEPQVLHGQIRADSISIKANDIEDGYFYDTPILTRTGVFEYHNPDGTVRYELRRPQDVFDPESLKSYLGKPIIITHDAGAVTKDNVKQHEVGTILSEGFADGEYVRAKIVLHDPDSVKASGYRELSLGYVADLIVKPGDWEGKHYDVIQTNIRVNHLAAVAVARAGENARLNMDGTTPKGDDTMDENKNIPVTADSGGEATAEPAKGEPASIDPVAFAAAMEAYIASHGSNPAVPNADSSTEESKPAAVTVTTEPEEQTTTDGLPEGNEGASVPAEEEKPAAAEDPIAAIVARRDAMEDCQAKSDINTLLAALEQLKTDGGCDTAEKEPDMHTDSADVQSIVREYVEVQRLGDKLHLDGMDGLTIREAREKIIGVVMPTIHLDGKDDAYVNALYDAAKENITRRKTTGDQLAQIFRADGAAEQKPADDPDDHRRRMIERQTNNEEE